MNCAVYAFVAHSNCLSQFVDLRFWLLPETVLIALLGCGRAGRSLHYLAEAFDLCPLFGKASDQELQ